MLVVDLMANSKMVAVYCQYRTWRQSIFWGLRAETLGTRGSTECDVPQGKGRPSTSRKRIKNLTLTGLMSIYREKAYQTTVVHL